ncbi:MAG: ATP-binding protein [Bryobacteraceae bacterium]
MTQRVAGEFVELRVEDTGVGIAEVDLPHVFERFYRAERTAGRTQEGTGIGLALVHDLAELQGGSVRVESTPGKGSVFTVSIPRGQRGGAELGDTADVERLLVASPQRSQMYVEEALQWRPGISVSGIPTQGAGPAARQEEPPARVLVADDNADMRDYIRRILAPSYEVIEAASGSEALAGALKALPDLVLADVMMPGIGGFELLRRLRADPRTRTVPVILISARAGEESRVEGLSSGADDYMVKPFSARELLARVGANTQMARTRRRAAEERERLLTQIEREQARLRAIIEYFPAGILFAEAPDGRVTMSNPQVEQLLWHPASLNSHAPRCCEELVQLALRGEVVRGDEFIHECPGARRTWVRAGAAPIRDRDGLVTGAVVVLYDIDPEKRVEQELRRANEELRRANQDLEQFAYSASHDLREPLRNIVVYSQWLDRRFGREVQGEAQQFLHHIIEGAGRMEMLIRDLLAYTTKAADGDDPAEPSNAGAVLDQILAMLSESIRTSGAVIEAGPLPVVPIQSAHLTEVFENLISNAIKYRKPDEPPHIRIWAERQEGYWVFAVRDHGIGIPPRYAQHVFGLFKRLHARSKYPGTGIGLAICQKIVERYGGRIWLDTEVRASVSRSLL